MKNKEKLNKILQRLDMAMDKLEHIEERLVAIENNTKWKAFKYPWELSQTGGSPCMYCGKENCLDTHIIAGIRGVPQDGIFRQF